MMRREGEAMTDLGEVRVEALGERPALPEHSEHRGEGEFVPASRAFTEEEWGPVGDDFGESL